MKDKKYNKDRGSITLYVLISMLFFLIVVVGIYMNVSNMKQKQEKEIKQIQEKYKQEEKLDTIYEQSYENYISVSTPTLEVYSGEINSENSELKGKAIGKNDNSMTTIYTSDEKNHVKFYGGKNNEKYLYSYMKEGKLTEISSNEIEITATETGTTIYTYLKDEKGNAGKFYTAITVKFTKLEDKIIYVAKGNTIKIGKIEGNSNIGEVTFGDVEDEKVILLNGNEITGLNGGTTILTATESNGGAKATVTVKVVEIKLDENRGVTRVGVNKTVSITEIINVEGAGTLKVESSDDTIATVSMDNNKVIMVPKKAGIVTIKITESKLGATATYELKVANVTLTPNGGKYTMPTEGKATIKTEVAVENADKIEVCWSNQSSWSVIDNNKIVSNENCTEGEYYLKVRINEEFIYTSNAFRVGKNTEDENKITILLSNTNLTNQEITATVRYGSTLTANKKAGYGENLTTAKNSISEATATQIKVSKNGYIYAEATDIAGNKVTASLQITNIDNLPPKAFTITTGTVTTSSITVSASTTDADATSTSAKTGIAGYRFSKDDGKTWSGYQTSGEYKFSDLIGDVSGVTYKIKVEAKDNVGNTIVTSKDIATIKDDDYYVATANKLLETISGRNFYKTNSSPAIAGIMYITTSRYWTVPIMVSTDSSAVNMYTSYDNNSMGTAGSLVYKGVTFYYSSKGQWMPETYYTSTLITLNDSSSRFTTMEEAATNLLDRYFYGTKQKNYEVFCTGNGGSGFPGVQKKIKGQNLTLSETKPTRTGYTFKGWASTNNSYNVEYTAGGNYTNDESKILYAIWNDEVPPGVPTVTYKSGQNSDNWQNNINIILSSTDDASGIACYEIDWTGDGNANTTTKGNFTPWNGYSSGNTRFRAVDNAGNKSDWTSKYSIHMDTEVPNKPTYVAIYEDETVYTSGTWTNKIVFTDISAEDGLSGIARIEYSTDKTNWNTLNFSAGNGMKEDGLKATGRERWTLKNRNDTVYFRAIDKAGNASEVSEEFIIKYDVTKPSIPTVTYKSGQNSDNWQNNINIILSSTDDASGIACYEIDWTGDGNANTTTKGNFTPWNGYSSGNTRFRSVDNVGNKSDWTSKYSIHMDTAVPTSTKIRIENVTTTGYDVYIDGVSDNASGINRIQFPTWTSSGGQDDIQTNWGSSSVASGENKGNGTYYYRVNVTDHKNECGTYNTHVYAYDNASNSSCIYSKTIQVPGVVITYNNNYNGASTSTVTKGYNSELGKLATPTRTGYTFVGWYTAISGGTQISESTRTPASNTTYYAHWTINQYTLTVNPGSSTYKQNYASTKSISAPSQSYTVNYNGNGGTTPTTTQTSSRNFTSWTLSGSGSISSNTANPTTYTYGAGNATLTANYNGTGNAITLPTPTRTGYTFQGWYDAESGGNEIGNAGASYSPTKNITLYAHWSDDIAPSIVEFVADTTKPTDKTVKLKVTATDQGSGIDEYTFNIKNKYIKANGNEKTVTITNENGELQLTTEFGATEVYVKVKDNAGNTTESKEKAAITIYDYNIDNEAELNAFKYSVNNANDMNFITSPIIQRRDISMTSSWTEGIGLSKSNYFRGTYNGNGKTISNLSITSSKDTSSEECSGLFNYLYSSVAVIKNVNLKNLSIKSSFSNVGGIVGYNEGTISGCSLENLYINSSSSNVGGIAGYSKGTVSSCNLKNPYIDGGSYYVGGIAGYSEGTISGCSLACENATSSKGVWRRC